MLEKLRNGEPLTAARLSSPNAKEKQIHAQGLLTVLRQIHDELDEAVLEAYGWGDLRSRDIPVASKEAPHSCGAGESAADAPREALSPSASLSPSRQECRDSLLTRLVDQVAILRKLIAGDDKSVVTPDAEDLSAHFGRKNKKRTEQIEGILETLRGLGQL